MESASSIFLTIVLACLCVCVLTKSFLSKDKSRIWAPITFITLFYLYYCVIPVFNTSREFEGFNTAGSSVYFHIGALLSYCSVLIGFFIINPDHKVSWQKWNGCISKSNAKKMAIILSLFALICYVPVRGFRFNFLTLSNELVGFDWDNQGLKYYLVGTISLFVASCCILLTQFKTNKALFVLLFWITLVTYIVSGFRYRIVILVISMLTVYYLHGTVRRVRLLPLALIAVVCYVGFNIMDHTRAYGNGINSDVLKSLSTSELTRKAGETERVYNYSIMVMHKYEGTGKREYFKPLINAAFMPIPRSLFPWKPKAEYMYEATGFVMNGGEVGSAYVNFVEAFMAFGWLGVIINGLFLGWFARRFWNNYRNNPDSLGAILVLSIFNGFTYVVVSRGYLAQEFNIFLYFVCLPFWILLLVKKVARFQ